MTIELSKIGEFRTGVFDEGAAEIPAYDAGSQRVYVVNGDDDAIDILDLSDPTAPTRVGQIDVSGFGSPNSVAVKDGLVAVAVEAATDGEAGQVQFFDTDGDFLGAVGVGVLPDMLTFTPDGGKVLVANEGEPVSDPGATDDPEGSITIITLGTGTPAERASGATAQQVDFTAFNGREEDLRADGVRIFPNVSAAQDFEPEYIAVSPDGTKAYVTLQENNAVAIVDLASAEVTAVVPLGLKDHGKGLPSLTEFPITDLPDLGVSAIGNTIKLGGFSGLWYEGTDADGNLKFVTVPDRGPNGDVTADGERPFLLPEYQAQVVRFTLDPDSGDVTIDEQLPLTRQDGTTPITGLPNIEGVDEIPVDALGDPLPYDPLGADLEGVVIAPDGTYWMVDEYRPAIYHFDTDGSLIDRFVPIGTADQVGDPAGTYGTETLPEEYAERRANRGFEAVALDSDEGILYAFIQTPLANPDRATSDNSSVIRMLGIDPATGEPVAEYVYLLEKPEASNVDKIGDAVYAGDGKFFVLERDSGLEPTAQKFIFEMNLTGATNLLDPWAPDLPAGETLEQQTADSLAALGIEPVNKIKVANLPSLGYLPSDKPEGLAVLDDGTLAVLNDNDFGLVPGAEAIALGLIRFDQPNGLDASNDDDAINIQNWPVLGMFMPDSIASFEVDGATYFVTANEGDDRGENEDIADLTLDPDAFPDAATLQEDENLGSLGASTIDGDLDGDGDFDQLQVYGGRSFTIWDEVGNLVFDPGEEFAQITAAAFPDDFNSTNDENDSFDDRSDNKGAEPEGLIVAEIDDVPYAFVGLERIGGVMVYDLSDPTAPEFVQYVNDRDFAGDPEADTAGDLGPEGFAFVSGDDSPTGEPLLIVANEISGSTAIYSIQEKETPDMFTLQLLHTADQEAGIPALDDAPNFSGVLNALQFDPTLDPDTQTLVLSSGDALLPGLVFNASDQVFGGVGFADILWQNRLGFEAITFGNHEFDLGLDTLKTQLQAAEGDDIAQFGLGLVIEEAQEVTPTPNTDAEGGFSASLNGDTLYIAGQFSDLTSDLFNVGGVDAEGNPESAVHLHLGDAGENGPILRNLSVTDNGDGSGAFSGIFTLEETEIAAVLADGTYINLHTADNPGGELRGQVFLDQTYDGAQFPYLSTNIDFTGTVLEELVIPDGTPQPNGAPFVNANSITSSIVIDIDGEPVGVVGATTPTLPTISSPGDAVVTPEDFDGVPTPEQLDALAAEIQAQVDQLLADNPGMNKVILQAHMQQLDIERGLAERLEGVDIIIGGGSNTRLFDENDRPRDGDSVQGTYPEFITGADGNPVALVNTDGNYKYVGRLVIDFDDSGVIVPESYDPDVSGAFATDDQGVADLNAESLIDPEIQGIADLLRVAINDQESNVFGITEVYLNGLRQFVRTEETNLGNLTADANLAIAQETDPTVMVSLKNGGGIRDDIGEVTVPPGGTGDPVQTPPEGIPGVKPDGGISQNDIANALRFNNDLSLLTLTAEELLEVLEHGFAASSLDDSNTQGRFPQIGGIELSVDLTREPGDRIVSAIIVDEDGTLLDVLVSEGELVGDASRDIRVVTLGFLADGGDGYPFPTGPEVNRVNLQAPDADGDGVEDAPRTGVATFAPDGSEQDALAEYLAANFPADDDPTTPVYGDADTPREEDDRVQNLAFREDGVAEKIGDGTEVTLTVEIAYFTEDAAFANTFGIYDVMTGEATILETNTDLDTNPDLAKGDILASLELTESAFENLGFFLVANGDRRNDFDALDLEGAKVAETGDGSFGIQLADGAFLDSRGVFFSDESKNANGDDHFQTFGTDTEYFVAVEDLEGLGDQDFNDLVFSVTATEQEASALLS